MNVSVIIPTLNEAERIATAVERAWEAGADEVIVVDGQSDDDTFYRAKSCRCVVATCPRGRAAQQNRGARLATGDVLLFLHADTWLAPGAVRQIRAAMERPQVIAGAFRQVIEAPGVLYRLIERGNALRVRLFRCAYGDQGIFIRRDAFERLGGFPDVQLLEDLILMRSLRRLGRPALLPGPINVSARRWRRHGVLRQTACNWLLLAAHRLGVPPKRLARWYIALVVCVAAA